MPKNFVKDMLTVLMAGGQGERLYPLTRDRAKPAVPFGGIYRIIDFTLSNCINSGLQKIYVLTQYKSLSLERHLGLAWNFLPRALDQFITTIPPQQRTTNSWYQGTADAIFQNIYTLQRERPKYVLILSGDHIYKMNYQAMLAFHIEKQADLTVACVEVPKTAAANQLGVMGVDNEWRITDFQEKVADPITMPERNDTCLASMGIYIFNTDILVRKISQDAKQETAHDFGKNIIPSMIKPDKVFAYNFVDENKKTVHYWRDVGTVDAYYDANMDLVNVDPIFNLYDTNWPIRSYCPACPPAKTVFAHENEGRVGTVLDSLVSSGCIISGGRVEKSILSYNVRVNSFSTVEGSVLMEGVSIGRHAKVRRAIIDKDVQIPEGMQIGYDVDEDAKRFLVSPSGIVVVPKGFIIDSLS